MHPPGFFNSDGSYFFRFDCIEKRSAARYVSCRRWASSGWSPCCSSCAISELSKDIKEPYCMPDGSPMVTTQAATVLAVYRHIAKTVAALEPERVQEVMDSLALAAGNLEPGTALELLLQEEHQDEGRDEGPRGEARFGGGGRIHGFPSGPKSS